MADVRFRPEQADIILGYEGGKMGVAAVPGSGKTFTLSHLAARLIRQMAEQGFMRGFERREVLIVTFTNTAVNSFRSRIAEILQQERGLLPYVGYRVRTLHGLAHDIVRERPALVGLSEDFQIIDERDSNKIIRDVAHSLLASHMHIFMGYFDGEAAASGQQLDRIQHRELPDYAAQLSLQFIQHAKNHFIDPVSLRSDLAKSEVDLPLAEFGLAVYEDYQRSLTYRGAVDFDDLVRLAILALRSNEDYQDRLRARWPYILEDEAQDSSRLQEEMLMLLSGEENWVRVGDPNQAINTTFTTADPQYLRDFLNRDDVQDRPLQTSGRSAAPIIRLANELVRWTAEEHSVLELRQAFKATSVIKPTAPDDPQANPLPDEARIHLHYEPGQNVSPELELELVAGNLAKFLAENQDAYTVAALVPENSRGEKLVSKLIEREIEYEELLRSTTATRKAASLLKWVLNYLSEPLNTKALVSVYREVWRESQYGGLSDEADQQVCMRVLNACRHLEQYIWPAVTGDWLDTVEGLQEAPDVKAELQAFRSRVQRWLAALSLPIDQLVLTLTQELFTDAVDIALGHKIAVVLRGLAQNNPDWRLPEFVDELRIIAENQRRFIGFDDVERGYEPQPGVVTVATMHAAKGLEWDRVYLMGVSNYGFPSAQPYDNYVSEKWFIRDPINLEAEMLAQLESLRKQESFREGEASLQARLDYAEERLRLLYVGITRAKRHLMITWNMGRFWQRGDRFINRPALPLVALAHLMEKEQ